MIADLSRRLRWLAIAALFAALLISSVLVFWNASAARLTVNAGALQVFTFPVHLDHVAATVDIDPNTLNPRSQGNFVTAYIELPAGFDTADVLVSTVVLTAEGADGNVPALEHPTEIGDHDGDGIAELMVKFRREEVIAVLASKSGDVTMVVSGQLTNGRVFEATDVIHVVGSAPGAYELAAPTPTASPTATPTSPPPPPLPSTSPPPAPTAIPSGGPVLTADQAAGAVINWIENIARIAPSAGPCAATRNGDHWVVGCQTNSGSMTVCIIEAPRVYWQC